MTDLPKRLINSHKRICKRGGLILVHHAEGGGDPLSASGRRECLAQCHHPTARREASSLRIGRIVRRRRTDIPRGERMSKFSDDLRARIDIINRMIPHAKTAERRALQKERADLEAKLSKVAA